MQGLYQPAIYASVTLTISRCSLSFVLLAFLQTHFCTECLLQLLFVSFNLFFLLFSEPLQSIQELTLKFTPTARFYFCYPALVDTFCLLELLGEEISQRISKPIQFDLRLDLTVPA